MFLYYISIIKINIKGTIMNKTFKYGLITLAVAGGLLVGPKMCSRFAQKKAQHKAGQEQSQDFTAQDAEYTAHIKDSVLTANGFKKNEDFWTQAMDLENQIDDLEWQNTPGGALAKSVFESGEQIVRKHMDMLIIELAKYGIEINNIIDITNDMSQNTEILMYGAYRDAGIEEVSDAPDYFLAQIIKNIDYEGIGIVNKQEINAIVNTRFQEMLSDLYTSRKTIEKSFAPFIAGGQQTIDNCATNPNYGYETCINSMYRTTIKQVEVYDSKLQYSFFKDPYADYKLEKLGTGRWRVVKKAKNGNVSKTSVFNHNVDYDTTTVLENIESSNIFSVSRGTNTGVRIYSCEVMDVKEAKKEFKPSNDISKKRDSLIACQNNAWEKYDQYERACRYADSIAQAKLKQRIAQRTRSK